MDLKGKKVAIVHDFLVQQGGAEKVLESICELFPNAPIYTLLYDREKMRGLFEDKDIKTSFIQKFPKFIRKRYQWLLPFLLVVPETFDLRDYDLIISSSGAWSKGIVTKLNTKHIAYIHSPMRFVWDYNERYLKEKGVRNSIFKRIVFSYLRIWDYLAAQRPEYLIANSEYTKKRIQKYYKKQSEVIYPPVEIIRSFDKKLGNIKQDKKNELNNYFLVVSRLSGYKKIDIIVEAFNKLGLPLIIIGEGEQEKKLRKIALENVKILGWKSSEDLSGYYENARGLIFAAEEDFGIVPVEAMLQGIPVIALRKGGLLEIINEGVNGEFFDSQTSEVISDGVRRFIKNENNYDKEAIKISAQRFSKKIFKTKLESFINKNIAD